MANTILDAFAGAEERQKADRVKAEAQARRMAEPSVDPVNAGKRAEVSEIIAAMTDDDLGRCIGSVAKWQREVGGGMGRQDAEDAVQDAIEHLIRWPKSIDTTRPMAPLVTFQAKRFMRMRFRKELNCLSLDVEFGEEEGGTLKDFIPFDDSRLETHAVLEGWYVKLYVKDLLRRVTKSDAEIADELGIRTHIVEALRKELRDEEGLGRGGSIANLWPKRACLDALRFYADEHGHAPSLDELEADRINLPQPGRLVALFGSRLNAYKAAGLRTGGKRGEYDESDKGEIAEGLVERARELGHWPAAKEIQEPGAAVIRKLFRTTARRKLYEAVKAELGEDALAGIDIPRPFAPSPAQRAQMIAEWADREKRWPGLRDFEYDTTLPDRFAVKKIFGSTKVEEVRLAVVAMLKGSPDTSPAPAADPHPSGPSGDFWDDPDRPQPFDPFRAADKEVLGVFASESRRHTH